MRRSYFAILLFAVLLVSAQAAEKIKLDGKITVTFEGCSDGSIRIEAIAPKGKAAAKEFELKRAESAEKFIRNADKTFSWKKYTITPASDGYTLSFNGNEIYTAKFTNEEKMLREFRTWKTAKAFFGFGESSRNFNLSDTSFPIYNESKYGDHAYLNVPFYITDTNVSVYYNAGGKDQIYFQSGNNPQVYNSLYKRIECFIRQDASAQECIAKFYAETNPGCMLPKWAFKFIQSKYGYKNQQEVIDVVDEFKKRNLPLGAVVLDLFWFNKMGDITWNKSAFPDVKKMDDYLESNGIKLITISEPFFTVNSQNYTELESSGLLCKNTSGTVQLWKDWWCLGDKQGGLFNPIGKNASKFTGEKYSAMLDSGIDGFWTDLGEPEKVPSNTKYNSYNEAQFHNYYNLIWSKDIYEGVHAKYPDKRLFFLSRSGYTGSGKYNVSVWSGDVNVSWTALEQQITYGLNAGLCGLPYWGSDVGGFSRPETEPELLVRWHEFGAFTPVYRAHGSGAREPWIFTDKETNIIRKYLIIRETLVPYIYSTARQTMNGLPMMRPVFFVDTEVPQEYLSNEYMFGDSLLIAPVTEEGTIERKVWLPSGNWYEFDSMQKITGGKEITAKAPLDTIPVYIKAGAIIPQSKNNTLTIFMLPEEGIKNTFKMYNDDGITEQYKNGIFTEIHFSLNGMKLTAEITGTASFAPESVNLCIPANTKTTDSDWTTSGLYKIKTVKLSDLSSEYTL